MPLYKVTMNAAPCEVQLYLDNKALSPSSAQEMACREAVKLASELPSYTEFTVEIASSQAHAEYWQKRAEESEAELQRQKDEIFSPPTTHDTVGYQYGYNPNCQCPECKAHRTAINSPQK